MKELLGGKEDVSVFTCKGSLILCLPPLIVYPSSWVMSSCHHLVGIPWWGKGWPGLGMNRTFSPPIGGQPQQGCHARPGREQPGQKKIIFKTEVQLCERQGALYRWQSNLLIGHWANCEGFLFLLEITFQKHCWNFKVNRHWLTAFLHVWYGSRIFHKIQYVD